MPKTITDSTGEETEFFTQEEVEGKQEEASKEAIDKYKEENPDKTEEIEKMQTDLEEAKKVSEGLQTQLDGEMDKEKNFKDLREAKKLSDEKIEELTTGMEDLNKGFDDKIATAKKEVLEATMDDHKNETLKTLAGDDEELKKKIEFHYDRLGDEVKTKEDITKKLTDAWTLAVPKEEAPSNTPAFSSVGGGNLETKDQTFSDEEKELGKKLAEAGGIDLEDKDFQAK